ncbi:MAG: relaxase/mobilization nuclease domain-containing protein [Defluviitaleaceae bacterium]|nr:relaxase/mobilization nuclease domain-containing protein [Defluviitaleaceae bacterium]
MATTYIKGIKASSGKSAAKTFSDCINYGTNPEKTDGGRLVLAYHCTPDLAPMQFIQNKSIYHANGGRIMRKDKDVLLYHMRQSFKPNEITPEEANRIGYELAMRFTKGKHAFVVSTHIDQEHIHNHIHFSAVDINAERKFHDFSFSAMALRRVSDFLCLENGLSIIRNPKQRSESFEHTKEIRQEKEESRITNRDILRTHITSVMKTEPKTFEEFRNALVKDFGWQYNERGKNISFTNEELKVKQPIRLRTDSLGEGFDQADIRAKIATQDFPKTTAPQNLLEQLEAIVHNQLQDGYKNRDAMSALSYLNDKNISSFENLDKRINFVLQRQTSTGNALRDTDNRISQIDALSYEIKNYNNGSKLYAQYNELAKKNPQAAKEFYEANRATLMLHQAARNYFEANGYGKSKGRQVPHPDTLKSERASLQKDRNKFATSYKNLGNQYKELQKARDVSRSLLQDRGRDLPQRNIEIDISGR